MFHLSIRLIALHLPEYSRTNWTFRPFLLSDHMDQAGPVVLVSAAEHENVIIIIMLILLDEIFLDLVLIQTNHALLILDVCLSQQKLQSWEISNIKRLMIFFAGTDVLLVDVVYNKWNVFEQRMTFFYVVLRIEGNFIWGWLYLKQGFFDRLLIMHDFI